MKVRYILLFFISFYGLTATETINENTCPTIKVGGGDWLKVEEFPNSRGSTAGASVLLLHKLPELIGLITSYGPSAPFARQLQQLKSGELDVVAGIYPTLERQKDYLFTDNYYYEKLFVFAKPEKIHQLKTISQLERHVGATIRGASYGPVLDALYLDNSKYLPVNNQTQRLQLLLHDRVDYFVGTIAAVGLSPVMKNISIAKKPIYRQGVALGFSPKTECKQWIPKINEIIASHFIDKNALLLR